MTLACAAGSWKATHVERQTTGPEGGRAGETAQDISGTAPAAHVAAGTGGARHQHAVPGRAGMVALSACAHGAAARHRPGRDLYAGRDAAGPRAAAGADGERNAEPLEWAYDRISRSDGSEAARGCRRQR